MATERGTFGRAGFVLAAVGSAIGLGNIWKFPYITYANDGGSFVLIYLVAIALIGAPIMIAEILVGRRTQQSAVSAFGFIAETLPGDKRWRLIGGLGVITGCVLLSYYAIIAGWTVSYFGRCLAWSVRGFDLEGPELGEMFGAYLSNAPAQIGFQAVFMALTVGVVALGVKKGIERVTKTLMPILFVILILLAINSIQTPGFGEAIRFLFHIGPIEADGVLEAVGHSFFTLSLGMAAMVTYGSYMSKEQSIPRSAITIAFLDTVIALMACVVMFSIIFSVPDAERAATFSQSATILFTTLPRMFYAMTGGAILAPLFYVLVSFAALTSTISLLEVAVSYFVDVRRWARAKAALFVGALVFLLGVPAALSLGAVTGLTNWRPVDSLPGGATGVFGVYDYTVSNWLLPVGGLLIATFVGWLLRPAVLRDETEIGHGPFKLFNLWLWTLRLVAPAAILAILVAVLGGRSFA